MPSVPQPLVLLLVLAAVVAVALMTLGSGSTGANISEEEWDTQNNLIETLQKRMTELRATNQRLQEENTNLAAAKAAAADGAASNNADSDALRKKLQQQEQELTELKQRLQQQQQQQQLHAVEGGGGGAQPKEGYATVKISEFTMPVDQRPSAIVTTPFDTATIKDAALNQSVPDGTWGDDLTINGYPLHWHHAWVGPYLTQTVVPDKSRYFASSFLAWHPGWKQTIWDAKMVREKFPKEVVELLEQFAVPAQIRDVLALMIPARFGGIFADMDVWCMRNFVPLMRGANEGAFAANEDFSNAYLTNTILASRPGHPIFERAWQRAILTDNSNEPNIVTGPYFLRKMFKKDPIKVYPPKTFYPCGYGYPQCADPRKFITDPEVYGVHQFEHTWAPKDKSKKPEPFRPMKPKIDMSKAFGIRLRDPESGMMCVDAWDGDAVVIWGCGERSSARIWAYSGDQLKSERGMCMSADYAEMVIRVDLCSTKPPEQLGWELDEVQGVLRHKTADGKLLCATAEHKHGTPIPLAPCDRANKPSQEAVKVPYEPPPPPPADAAA